MIKQVLSSPDKDLLDRYLQAAFERAKYNSGLVIGASVWSAEEVQQMRDEILKRMATK